MAAATSAASLSPTKLVHLREEHRKSLQSNVEQFKHLQALSKKPISPPQPTTLRVRATNLASQDEVDRNAAICRAVLVLWNNIQKMRCLRRWRDVTNDENQRIHDTAVRTVQQSTRELLAAKARGDIAAYSSEQVALLVEWAVQTKSFDGIDRVVLEDVVQHMHLRQLKDKECLFFEGDVGLFYYFLFTGSIAIYVDMPAAAKATLASSRHEAVWNARKDPTYLGTFMYHIPEGDGFGEVAMFNDEARRTASAVAAGPCELIEIPKPVYVRTLLPHHFAVYNKAQKMAFLPSVDVFADWIQAKIAGLSDLMERHDLAFGHRLVVADRPIQALFVVISGEVRVTQPWLTPVAEHKQAIHTQLKQPPKKYIDVEVERVGRRGYVGLPLLLFSDAKSISKVDAVVSTNVAEVYILKRDNLAAYRALMPANGTAQVMRRWNDQQRQRTERYLRAVSVLQRVSSAQPSGPSINSWSIMSSSWVEPQPATVDEDEEKDKLPLLPIMVSSSGKKFLFPDWDLLVDRSNKPVVASMAAPPPFVHIDPSEQGKIAAQSFTAMSEMPHMFQWDPPHGFSVQPKTMSFLGTPIVVLPSIHRRVAVPKAPPRLEKLKASMPAMDKTFERSISRTRQLARAVVKEHNAFVKSRAIATPRPSSFKHSF
ncbi:unnamed protein product [Aphanomyces euteiches]